MASGHKERKEDKKRAKPVIFYGAFGLSLYQWKAPTAGTSCSSLLKAAAVQKQVQDIRCFQGFEPPTPRRDPRVTPNERSGHTFQLATSATSSRSGNRWFV